MNLTGASARNGRHTEMKTAPETPTIWNTRRPYRGKSVRTKATNGKIAQSFISAAKPKKTPLIARSRFLNVPSFSSREKTNKEPSKMKQMQYGSGTRPEGGKHEH